MAALIAVLPATSRSSDVFLDWDGAMITMAAAWSAAGYGSGAALTGGEISGIIAMTKGKLEAKFAGLTVGFHDSVPLGSHEWVKMGATTSSTTTYGSASGIDWKNTIKDGGAEMYLANFGPILSASMFTRGENISRFSSAIANTAAHELGHVFGLQHYDAYFVPTITAPAYGFSGQQNFSMMATGSTGLATMDRAFDRLFNPYEKIKLQYADGIAPTLGKTVAEAAGDKSSLATAQTVYGGILGLTPGTAVNIEASTSAMGEIDVYRFFAEAGAKISANTLSHGILPSFTDTTITLMDGTGTAMHTSTDISFFLDEFMTPTSDYYSDDSLYFNFVAPHSGTYYLKVSGTGPGDYDLLMTGISAVPEPGTMAVIAVGIVALLRKRKGG